MYYHFNSVVMMEFQFSLLIIPILISASITAAFAVLSYRRWKSPVARPFSLMMAAATLWTLGSALQLMSADLVTNYIATIIEYPGIVTVPVAWFFIVLHYTGGDRYVTKTMFPLFFIIPALSVFLVITNPLHHLYYSGFYPVVAGNLTIWVFSHGPLFWIHVIYSYTLSLLGLTLVITKLNTTHALFRRQMALLLLACAVPVAANIAYVFSFGPVAGLDLTPFLFTLSGLIVAFGIVRYRLFSLMPVAYYRIFRTMTDGVIVTDSASLVVDINPAAETILAIPARDALAKNIREILPDTAKMIDRCSAQNDTVHEEISIPSRGGFEYYDAACIALDPVAEEGVGHLIILRNITLRKQAGMALDEANRKLNLMASITRHDILNQITALNCYIDMNADLAQTPEQSAYIEKQKQIIAVIKEQIDFTKEYQNLGIELPRWQDLPTVLTRAISRLDFGTTGHEVHIGQYEVYADPMLEKVFFNLLDNALRYGESLTSIIVTAKQEGENLIITFADNGVGIPPEDKDKLFTRGFGKHTGLGLFLSREILSITKITISETGSPGMGAQFEIHVPQGSFRIRK
jgi:signal transduction histidine kinase